MNQSKGWILFRVQNANNTAEQYATSLCTCTSDYELHTCYELYGLLYTVW